MKSIVNTKDIGLLKRCLMYLFPYKLRIITTFFCIVFCLILQIIEPLILGKVIALLFSKEFAKLSVMLIYLFITELFVTILSFFQSYLFSSLSENIIYDLKRDMFQKIIELPVKAYDQMKVGEFISRLQGDTATVASILTNQLINTAIDILRVVIICIVVFQISVPLSLVILISFPVTFFIFTFSGKKIRRRSEELAKLNDNYFSNLQQSITGIREIKSLGIKKIKINQFLNLASLLREKNININVIGTVARSLSQFTSFLSQLSVMAIAGFLIYKGQLNIEYFIAFTSYSSQLTGSLMNITQISSNIQKALTSLERIFNLLDEFGYKREKFGDMAMQHIEGEIKFCNISFGYGDDLQVVDNLSFTIAKNNTTAIVGSSGGGKTTIFNLLLHFYEADTGAILIDGIDINHFNEETLRQHISVVHQTPYLFNATFAENMLIANQAATEEEMIAICKQIKIHDYIMSLPHGYKTVIEENGANLSGGQKQRIAIARAMLKKSKIILFDEATSSLDNETQQLVKELISSISHDHTVVVIAHRLSSIIDSDEILVIDAGKLVGQGSHRNLLNNNFTYKKLYESELECRELIS
ncbi:ABC transporter ATP-binding protein [Paenibacillus riograndensis]|uniref:Multidrug ABC transporter ATPase and permease n=3 Tax=Paenibacillus riograndensis TaxID=483937 RepID=A0A0E4HGS7_9BACL|nr:ABC transporter ATP-binding protein [Paenibacillus riograndensis]CQR57710.1 multidrug ABC transporter ATPase and permease [Paenibacillus riograndensis SBR5]